MGFASRGLSRRHGFLLGDGFSGRDQAPMKFSEWRLYLIVTVSMVGVSLVIIAAAVSAHRYVSGHIQIQRNR
jgi:hypothetical protein